MNILIKNDEDFKKLTSYLDTTDIKWALGQKPSLFNPINTTSSRTTYPYSITMGGYSKRDLVWSQYNLLGAVSVERYFESIGYIDKPEPIAKVGQKIIVNDDSEFNRLAELLEKQGCMWGNNKLPTEYNPTEKGWLKYPIYILIADLKKNSLSLLCGTLKNVDYNSFLTVPEFFNDEENKVTAEYKDGIITISDVEYDMEVPKELIIELYNKINA